ncbi:hypothetical protein MRX96_032748 [Rhipicephalus microplus]
MDASVCPGGRLHGYAAMLNQSDVFVVLSAAAAVLAFGINMTQALVILCLVWRSWKCAYHLALALCGLLSAAALLWHVVALRLPDDHGARDGCGAIPSALSVALLIGYVAHVTAPVVHRCVADTWPRAFAGHARNRGLCVLLSGFAWCETVLLAVTVLSDWPSASQQRGATSAAGADLCTLPQPWSSAFSTFVCALFALHVVVDLAVLIDMTASAMRKSRAVAAPQPLPTIAAAADSACRRGAEVDDDDDFFGEGGGSSLNRVDLGPLWCRFVLLLLGTLPMIAVMFFHMVSLPPSASPNSCPSFRDVLPLWTLLCTIVLGVALPVGSVSSDPVVAEGSVHIIRILCCFLRRKRRVAPARGI